MTRTYLIVKMLNKFRSSGKSSSTKSKEMPKTSKKEIIDPATAFMAIQNNGSKKSGATQDQRILNLDYGRWEASILNLKDRDLGYFTI